VDASACAYRQALCPEGSAGKEPNVDVMPQKSRQQPRDRDFGRDL
jgi:hypothetical protein